MEIERPREPGRFANRKDHDDDDREREWAYIEMRVGEAELSKNVDAPEEKLEEVDDKKPDDEEERNGNDLRCLYLSDLVLDDEATTIVA
ncbi:hypothetical protein ACFX1Q_041443 [Malus domestica]